MAGAVVGIDLGTTNTVVAVVRGGKALVLADETGARLLPSVVSFHPNGEVLVGNKARERRLVDARNTVYSIKRLIGRSWQSDEVARARQRFPFELREGPTHGPLVVARNETYTLPEISAFVLRRAKAIAEKALGEPVERAVVTVPASFNDLQRASTKVAAREAGLEVLRILNEPTAAALAYGFGKSGSERIAVYDFGGGTFDLTLLDLSGNVFEVIATAGDSFLGGDDVDNVIADRIAQTVIQQTRFDPRGDVQVMERLRAAAESVKIALSSQQEMSVELKEIGYGPGGKAIDLKFSMGRTELEQLAGALVERTFNVCSEALQLARLKNDAFDNIILVGGSTRIPLVRRKVEGFFGKKPMDRVNPDEVVAIGAAIQAAALTGAERRRQSTPAPILNTDAVKQSRIQTLGGVGKDKAKGPLAPPPPRTTGRLVGPPIQPEPPTMSGAVAPEAYSSDSEVTVNRAAPFPAGAPPAAPNTRPPPPQREPSSRDQYPSIPGAMPPPGPARPMVTAPMVPPSQSQKPLDRTTGRMIAPGGIVTPLPGPPIVHVPPPSPLDASPEPQPMPRGFPDLSPEPMQLQNLPRGQQPPPQQHNQMFPPPGIAPPPMPLTSPQPAPGPALRTQVGMAAYPQTRSGAMPGDVALPPPPATPSLKSTQIAQRPMPESIPPLPGLPGPEAAPRMMSSPTPFTSAPSSWPPAGPMGDVPLLIDVTPLTLSVETVGGYVDRVIARNTPVPCSQTRKFTTSVDNQALVIIRVCQGEGDMFPQNTALGELELSGLRRARRGAIAIEVTFELDADGILQVRARDVETGRQTGAQMRLVGLDQPAPARPAMQM
jgi:molecular chaperone DnaK